MLYIRYHGGWLAPNIYYLGAAGVIEVGGVRIAGISGIYKSHDYYRGRYETMPYNNSDIRSTYHTRVLDVFRLKLLADSPARPDMVMSHDWPNSIEQHGDTAGLIRRKPFFKDEINTSTLGSPPLLELLQTLKPRYWFSAHLHVKFAALYKHARGAQHQAHGVKSNAAASAIQPEGSESNPEALDIDLDDEEDAQVDEEPNGHQGCSHQSDPDEMSVGIESDEEDSHEKKEREGAGSASIGGPPADPVSGSGSSGSKPDDVTHFLALSKCLPGQDFLQFLDIEAPDLAAQQSSVADDARAMPSLRYSLRWLAILRATHSMLTFRRQQSPLPSVQDPQFLQQIENEEEWVRTHLGQGPSGLDICAVQQFAKTAPAATDMNGMHPGPPPWYTNPQTEAFCRWLDIPNQINPPPTAGLPNLGGPSAPPSRGPPVPMHFPQGGPAAFAPPLAGMNPFPHGAPPSHSLAMPPRPAAGAMDEAEEVRRIEEAASRARDARSRKRHKPDVEEGGEATVQSQQRNNTEEHEEEREPLRLDDDEDEAAARWKEGAG